MNITVVGNESTNKRKLIKNVNKAIDNVKLDIILNMKVIENTKKYNIKNSPALIINEDLVCEGKVLSDREIARYIKQYEN